VDLYCCLLLGHDIPRHPPRTKHGGGVVYHPRICPGPISEQSESNPLPKRCDARGLQALRIEIIAKRKALTHKTLVVDGRPGLRRKKGHETRGPQLRRRRWAPRVVPARRRRTGPYLQGG
jgi:hypothetical protein